MYLFPPDAEQEFNEAIDYYEVCKKGLGYEFAIEVRLTIDRILIYPTAWHIMERNIRRALVNRFPYGVIYTFNENEVYILAVMHLNRKPGYWKSRK